MKATRAAVVCTRRTPFAESFGVFEQESALSLSSRAVTEVLASSGVDPADVGDIIWGTVVPPLARPNLARDIALFSGLPRSVPGVTVGRACASSLTAVQIAADSIRLGRHQVVVAGGSEVLSRGPIAVPEELQRVLTQLSKATGWAERLALLGTLRSQSFLPRTPALLEPFAGLTMGQHGEAAANGISRAQQDAFTIGSHRKASLAWASGALGEEVVPVWTGTRTRVFVDRDNLVRKEWAPGALGALPPLFDKGYGTLTSGNSAALADGAAAVLLASESYAKERGLPVLGFVVESEVTGVDPRDQLFMGPALAIPSLLARLGLGLGDMAVVELHEACAAQVLSVLGAWEDRKFCKERLGLSRPWGGPPEEKVNPQGGSLAYGHALGATGARLVGSLLRQLPPGGQGVIGMCAAGGMGQAMVLERP